MGNKHSLMTLLKKDIPSLFILKYACSKLPRVVEDLVRDVYGYFSSSPKRVDTLKKFQNLLELKPHKLLHPSQTRWLSLLAAVDRFLEQYDALEAYFASATSADRLLASETIHKRLQGPVNKLFLLFLSFVLPVFNNLNKQMQSDAPQFHKLLRSAEACVRTIMDCYLKRSYTQGVEVSKVEFRNPKCFLPMEDVYVSGQATALLSSRECALTAEQSQFFRLRCLDFYVESVDQILKRIPFQESVLRHLELLDPAVCMNGSAASIAPLAQAFPNLVSGKTMQALDTEWRYLRNADIPVSKESSLHEFWGTVFTQKHCDGSTAFPALTEFVSAVLCLPHSSAAVPSTT
ncbi:uncharacterized protein LOC119379780 [Rhipicephalus sanguineus]|uniref:uncharacterized protein LOC119379780 n=1 Tax=Rhipicephalus sanguineus TaxID=34632 RepID=UPI0020C3B13D|nr:uncharacterized protein LOC119379780 [Rhipicephalus sanguineus]